MSIFKVGDRVVAINEIAGFKNLIGKKGTVCHFATDGAPGIEFDERFQGGHNCNGHCKEGYGRYGSSNSIKRLNDLQTQFLKNLL